MDFSENPEDAPALLAQAKNIETVLRQYKRSAIDQYLAQGFRQYLAQFIRSREQMVGVDTIENFVIVPMAIVPKFDKGYTFQMK